MTFTEWAKTVDQNNYYEEQCEKAKELVDKQALCPQHHKSFTYAYGEEALCDTCLTLMSDAMMYEYDQFGGNYEY